MKAKLFLLFVLLSLPFTGLSALNALTEDQVSKGWKLLFNGKDLEGWRTYARGGAIGEAWEVRDGILVKKAGVKGGDLMTVDAYEDFDLSWEWRISKKGNNGIKYFITEERKAPVGHEYQMLDDEAFSKLKAKSLTASFYDVLPAADEKRLFKPGAWNHSRIFVLGDTVEHWLNGERVLQYQLGGDEVLKAVQDSKFKKLEGFGSKIRGHILLTDHKDECCFKNIRIREFK